MGILKHAVLPGFALVHAGSIFACKDLKTWAGTVGLPKQEVSVADDISVRQNHMLSYIRGFNVAMMFLCGMGFLRESAHFREEIVIGEALLFSTVAVDAYRQGVNYFIPGAQAAIAAIGAVINSMEPGIFTKDKKA